MLSKKIEALKHFIYNELEVFSSLEQGFHSEHKLKNKHFYCFSQMILNIQDTDCDRKKTLYYRLYYSIESAIQLTII